MKNLKKQNNKKLQIYFKIKIKINIKLLYKHI